MATSLMGGVRLAGLVTCVPSKVFDNQKDTAQFDSNEVRKIVDLAGIKRRRISEDGVCASDLSLAAAKRLFEKLDWDPNSIDALVMVTQTPDFTLPGSSAVLHQELELAAGCASFDINLGCSGYPYGLWVASMMVHSGSARRVLLVCSDTGHRLAHIDDRSTFLLFGDAGSVTALEAEQDSEEWGFSLHTDGKGLEDLIVRGGAYRHPDPENELDNYIHMSGTNVFNFTIQRVPPLIEDTLALTGKAVDDIDAFILHQSNQFMMKHLAKKCGIPASKLPIILAEYGNCGGPSVPLTITQTYPDGVPDSRILMLLGYGVGLSWASALVRLTPDSVVGHCEI